MAYNEADLTRLKALKQFGERIEQDFAHKDEFQQLSDKVDGIEAAHGEANVIEEIDVNGVKQTVEEGKKVNITVPTQTSDLTNNSDFQTGTQVSEKVAAAISETGHATFEKVESLPSYEDAKENVLYLLKNDKTNHYDIYAKIEGSSSLELLDDTSVDLSEYIKSAEVDTKLNGYVAKDGNKVLSEENFTSAEKTKLAGLNIASDEDVQAVITEVFGA